MRSFFYLGTFFSLALGGYAQQAAPPVEPSAPPAAAPRSYALPNQREAEKIADTVYNTWRLSMQRGDASAWKKATSSARQVKVRNAVVSLKGRFPDDFFKGQQVPPALENFKFIGALMGGTRNNTMAATYLGKMQLGEKGKAAVNAYVLQLVYERTGWKLDQANFFNLSKLDGVRKRLEKGDLSVLQEQDGFHPYDEVPIAPGACNPPQLIGKVFVDAPGRDIEMRINGVSAHSFADERRADVISGGLNRGQNTITYTIRTEEGKPHPSMAIGLFVMPETPGNHPVCVFDHIIDEKDAAEGGSFTFTISNATIGSMNPKYTGPKPQPLHAVPLRQKPAKK